MDRCIMFTWRLNPLTNNKFTRRALWPSEDVISVCWHCAAGSPRGAAKPFLMPEPLPRWRDAMRLCDRKTALFSMHHVWKQDVLGVVGSLVTRLSAQARGGTHSVLWHKATAVYQRLSRQNSLNYWYRPKGYARATARLRQEMRRLCFGHTVAGTSTPKAQRSPTGDDR